jgi:hypothetical protein
VTWILYRINIKATFGGRVQIFYETIITRINFLLRF